MAQKTVTGTVKDDSGDPMPGVNVIIAGTTNGTITNVDGHYSIQVPDDNAILHFSFIGMEAQDIPVAGKSVIDVALKSSAVGLDEVVVTSLGITREKKSLGYAVDEVESDEIAKGATSNYLKNLDGKVTGVNITSFSSDPTSSAYVVIRGATSLTGLLGGSGHTNLSSTAQPLYVIDGVPVGNGGVTTSGNIDAGNFMSEMSSDDIKSVTVLKGASATALYGSEGGNGVILITTKSGKSGKKGIGVSVNSSMTFDQAYKSLPIQTEYVGGEYERTEALGVLKRSKGWGLHYTDAAGIVAKQWDMEKQMVVDAPIERRYTNERPVEDFMDTGITSTNNIAISGNYDKGTFRLSYTNLVNKSIIPSSKTSRNTVALEASYNVTDKFKVSGSAQYIKTYAPNKQILQGRGDGKSSLIFNIYAITADKQPWSAWQTPWITGYEGIMQNSPFIEYKNYLGNGDEYDRRNYRTYKNANPYFVANEIIKTFSRESVVGKVQFDWDLLESLKLTGRTGLSTVMYNYQDRTPWDITKYIPKGAFYSETSENSRINNDIFLTFDKTFGKFNINALAGYNFRITNNNYAFMGGRYLARPNDFSIGAISKDNLSRAYSWGTSKYSSIYATASFGWANMLYLDASVRKDWVGITDLQKNSSVYPGASLSWLPSETFEMPSWVTMLKLRGGIAQVGYGIPTYLNVDTYGISGTWNGVTTGSVGGSVVNPDISPETNTTYEGGLDVKFFNNRLGFNGTYFKKVHANQIQDIPIVSSTGFSSYRTNIGTVTSDGVEIEMNFVPVRTNDWEWDISANFSKYKATVTSLDPSFGEKWIGYPDGTKLRLKEGETIGNMYASEGFQRVINPDSKYYGMIILKNHTGTPIEDDNPETRDFLGNFNPDFMMGFTTNLKYKAFALNVVMSYRNGGVYVSETAKRLRDDGKSPYSVSGDGIYWMGGRSHDGGYAWPNPADQAFDILRLYNTGEEGPNQNGEFRDDASYWIGVYVDPTSDYDPTGRDLPDDAYILNGEDPNTTFYGSPTHIVGNTWDFPQTRTFDATNFKVRDISLTYDLPKSFVGKIGMQSASFSVIARNIYLWTKSGRNEDPETAFGGAGTGQGVAHYTLPPVRQVGFKLGLTF